MTPLPSVDADAWRLAVILFIGSWLAVDPSPLGWPYYWWLVGLGLAVWVYYELGGDGPPAVGDELEQDRDGDDLGEL